MFSWRRETDLRGLATVDRAPKHPALRHAGNLGRALARLTSDQTD